MAVRNTPRRGVALAAILAPLACATSDDARPVAGESRHATRDVEATSLLGAPLARPPLAPERTEELERDLAAAEAALAAAPLDEDAWIWYGRRLAYLGRFRDALDAYTRALAIHPDSARLLRHRGHRYLTVRELARAEDDLARAAELCAGRADEIELDGAPNAAGIPTGTLQSNVFYHLGLARYLRGDFAGALEAYRECLLAARTLDTKVAAAYWTTLTLTQLERRAEAAQVLAGITPDLPLLENHAYLALLLCFAGVRSAQEVLDGAAPGSVDRATRAYGLAVAALARGDRDEGIARLADARSGDAWHAFGALAAEAEAARRGLSIETEDEP
jgi:tetratricopeptide (TPR) repeat protein